MKRRRSSWLASIALVAVVAAGCGSSSTSSSSATPPSTKTAAAAASSTPAAPQPQAAPAIRHVIVGVPGKGMSYLPFTVAIEKGYLKQKGIAAKVVVMSSSTMTAALDKGSIQFMIQNPTAVALADLHGLKMRVVEIMTSRPQHFILSKHPYTSFSQLAGKVVGVDQAKGLLGLLVSAMEQKYHVKVKELPTGVPAERLAALEKGMVAAEALDVAGAVRAENAGYHVVVNLGTIPLPLDGLDVTSSLIQQHPGLVQNFIEACLEGARFIQNHPKQTVQISSKWSNLSLQLTQKAFNLVRTTWGTSGQTSSTGWQTAFNIIKQLNPKATVTDGQQLKTMIWDPTPLSKAVAAGA